LRRFVLDRVHVDGSGEAALLAAVVEVQVGQHHTGDVLRCQFDRGEGVHEGGDTGAVPLVDPGVVDSDTGVDQERPVRVADHPGVHREGLERRVLRVRFSELRSPSPT
jgi:hypothetical protein